jgi:hypothetical protein
VDRICTRIERFLEGYSNVSSNFDLELGRLELKILAFVTEYPRCEPKSQTTYLLLVNGNEPTAHQYFGSFSLPSSSLGRGITTPGRGGV